MVATCERLMINIWVIIWINKTRLRRRPISSKEAKMKDLSKSMSLPLPARAQHKPTRTRPDQPYSLFARFNNTLNLDIYQKHYNPEHPSYFRMIKVKTAASVRLIQK